MLDIGSVDVCEKIVRMESIERSKFFVGPSFGGSDIGLCESATANVNDLPDGSDFSVIETESESQDISFVRRQFRGHGIV